MEASIDNNPIIGATLDGVFYADPQEAMRLHAQGGFKGRLVAVRQGDRPAPAYVPTGPTVAAGIVGFEDTDATLVLMPEDGKPVVSLYDDPAFAADVASWCEAGGAPGARLVDLTDCGFAIAIDVEGETLVDRYGVPVPTDELDAALGLVPVPTVVVKPEPMRVTIQSPTLRSGGPRTVDAATFSSVAATRIEDNNRWLAQLGVVRAPSPTTTAGFKPGTTVVSLGYENLATKRREWETQPRVAEGAEQIVAAVAAEEREDVTVRADRIHMRSDGSIDADGRILTCEPQGFAALLTFLRTAAAERDSNGGPVFGSPEDAAKARQLATLDEMDLGAAHGLFPRAAQAYLAMDPDFRAMAFNRQMAFADGREIVLRTRRAPDAPGGRSQWGAVSTGYTPFDADRVVRTLAEGLGRLGLGELRGEALYNPATASVRIDAFAHAPADVVDFAAGDVFKAGMRFRSDDAGGGSVRGGGAAWWNECLNLIIIHAQRGEVIRLVHKGSAEEIDRELRAGLVRHSEALRHFAKQWGLLRETDIAGFSFRGVTYANVEEAVKHLVEQRELDGVAAKNVLCEYVMTAHQRQGGGDTLQSILDAFTRAAHEALLAECVRERFEGAAGRLVPVLARAAAEA